MELQTHAFTRIHRLQSGPALFAVASGLAREGRIGESWTCARAGLGLCRVLADWEGVCAFSIALGRIAWSRGLAGPALDFLDAGIVVARRSMDREALFHLLTSRVGPAVALGRLPEALDDCREAFVLTPHVLMKVRSLVMQAALLAAVDGGCEGVEEGRRRCAAARVLAARRRLQAELEILAGVASVLDDPVAVACLLPALADALLASVVSRADASASCTSLTASSGFDA